MPHAGKTAGSSDYETPNSRNVIEVGREQLPLHCPTPQMSLWNSHPRVYIPLDETPRYRCPYCGTEFVLRET